MILHMCVSYMCRDGYRLKPNQRYYRCPRCYTCSTVNEPPSTTESNITLECRCWYFFECFYGKFTSWKEQIFSVFSNDKDSRAENLATYRGLFQKSYITAYFEFFRQNDTWTPISFLPASSCSSICMSQHRSQQVVLLGKVRVVFFDFHNEGVLNRSLCMPYIHLNCSF